MLLSLLTAETESKTNEIIQMYMDWVKNLDIYRDIGLRLPSPLDNVEFFGIALLVVILIAVAIVSSIISSIFDKINAAKDARAKRKRQREHDKRMQELINKREERELQREERELRMEEKQDRRFEQQMQAQIQSQEMLSLYTQFMVAAKMQNIQSLMDMSYDNWLVMYNKEQAKRNAQAQQATL